jgi:hypothetical protein
MVIKLKSLFVDIAAEREGEWIEVKEWSGLDPEKPWEVIKTPGLAFCVHSVNDPEYKVARQALVEDVAAMRAEGKSEAEIEEAYGVKEGGLIADRLLRGWRGLDEAYDPPAARATLLTPESRVLRIMIVSAAQRAGMRKVEFVKEAEKN